VYSRLFIHCTGSDYLDMVLQFKSPRD
jgi:hypothetical protein